MQPVTAVSVPILLRPFSPVAQDCLIFSPRSGVSLLACRTMSQPFQIPLRCGLLSPSLHFRFITPVRGGVVRGSGGRYLPMSPHVPERLTSIYSQPAFTAHSYAIYGSNWTAYLSRSSPVFRNSQLYVHRGAKIAYSSLNFLSLPLKSFEPVQEALYPRCPPIPVATFAVKWVSTRSYRRTWGRWTSLSLAVGTPIMGLRTQ
jgi:hypothetical protein